MRWLLIGVSCVTLAGCGKAPERTADGRMQTFDVAEGPPRAPGIAITAAPGVAFTYRYGFRLPAARIAPLQEAHAQACEKLGPARCRITGMSYHLSGENDIEGDLTFKLDPALARGFGKDGIAAVEQARGTLVDARITGTDAGGVIDQQSVERARAAAAVRRIDAQLAKTGRATERAELQAQRAEAARRIAAANDTATNARTSLATTPVTFDYGSGPAVRGFDTSAPLTSALDTAVASAQATFAVILAILAVLGPPALVVLLGLLLVRRLRIRWPRRPVADEPPVA